MDQIVVPPTGLPSASVQRKAAPPQSCTSMPRCRLYQACIAFGSLALKKMPPIPVTRFMCTSRGKMSIPNIVSFVHFYFAAYPSTLSRLYMCSLHGRNARSFLGRFGLFDVAIQCLVGPRNVQISSLEVSKCTIE